MHTQPNVACRRGSSVLRLCPVTAFDGMVRNYELICDDRVVDIASWLRLQLPLLSESFSPLVKQFVVRGMFYVKVIFVRVDLRTGIVVDRITPYIPSHYTSQIVDLSVWLEEHIRHMLNTFEKFTNGESSWVLDGIEKVLFKINLTTNYDGRAFFTLPTVLKNKKAVVNVNCTENCFKYALLSVLHYNDIKDHRERVTAYRGWEEELNFEGVNLNAVDISRDVAKVEKLNNLKINVHVWEKNELKGICYNQRNNLSSKTINLLLVINSKGERHYCGISSLSRLYHHTEKSKAYSYICQRCVRPFKTQEQFEIHFEWCRKGKAQIETMPKKKEFRHTSFGHELSPLRVIYADAECYIEPETKAHLPAAIGYYEVWHSHHSHQC